MTRTPSAPFSLLAHTRPLVTEPGTGSKSEAGWSGKASWGVGRRGGKAVKGVSGISSEEPASRWPAELHEVRITHPLPLAVGLELIPGERY